MVAIVSGNSLGLERTSLGVLGSGRGAFGQAAQGQGGELVYVNAATGNLVVQRRDELLMGMGLDIASVRTYNSLGQLSDDNGDHWSNGIYAQQLQLVGVVNQAGSSIVLTSRDGTQNTYTWDGSAYSYSDPAAGRQTIGVAGSIYTRTDTRSGASEIYEGGRLTSQTDADGKLLQYSYYSDADRNGLLASVSDASGEVTRYTYNAQKQLLSIAKDLKQADGSTCTLTTVRYGYDTSNRLSSVSVDLTPEDGKVLDGKVYTLGYTYEGSSTRIATISQNGQTQLSFTYDAQGRVQTCTDAALQGTTTFTYGSGQTTVTDAGRQDWIYKYDAQGRLQSVCSPSVDGSALVQSYTYDADGRLLSETDGAGQTSSYSYDAQGNLLTQTDPLGRRTVYAWGSANQLLSQRSTTLIEPGIAAQTGLSVVGGRISKPAGSAAAWGTGFVASPAYMGSASISFMAQRADRQLEVGLARNQPGSDYAPTNINWGLDCGADGKLRARLGASLVAIQVGGADATYAAGDLLQIGYDAGQVRFYRNGQLIYQCMAGGADALTGALYLQGSFYAAESQISALRWGGDGQPECQTRYIYDSAKPRQLRFEISPEGQVTEHRYDAGGQRVETRQYTEDVYALGLADAAPTLAQMTTWAAQTSPAQNVQRTVYSYDSRGQLDTVKQASGAQALALTAQTVYDSAGRLLQVIRPGSDGTDQAGDAVTAYAYDGMGRQIAQTTLWGDGANSEASSSRTVTAYLDAQNRIEVTNSAQGVLIQSLDAAGRVIGTQRRDGATTTTQSTLVYDKLGRLARSTDASDARCFYLYDAAGRLVGQVLEQGVDSSNKAIGRLTEYVLDGAGRTVREHSYAAGVLLSAFYDANNQPLATPPGLAALRPSTLVSDTQGTDLRRIWSAAGQLAYQIDAKGGVTAYQYDGQGRLAQSRQYASAYAATDLPTLDQMRTWEGSNANGAQDRTVRQFYDGDGHRVAELDGEGFLTGYTYDGAGRLVVTRRYATAVSEGLRASGSLAAITPAAQGQDQVQTLYYNGRGLLEGQVDAEGYVTQNAYNSRGLLRTQTRYALPLAGAPATPPDWRTSFATLISGLSAQGARTRSLSYTRDDLLKTETDYEGSLTTYTYDSNRRLTQVTRGNSGEEQRSSLMRYDVWGRKTAQVSGEGAAAVLAAQAGGQSQAKLNAIWADRGDAWRWDASDRLIGQTDANGQVTSYYYAQSGQLSHTINQRGEVTENRYDILGRLTEAVRYGQRLSTGAGAGGVLAQAVRDALALQYGGEGTSRLQYGYDSRSRLTSLTAADGAVTTYSYNAFGEEAQRKAPWQSGADINAAKREETSSYDRRGLRLRVDLAGQGIAAGTSNQVEYDAFGRVSARIDALGRRTQLAWDRLGRQIQVRDALLQSRDTTYDAFGQVLSVKDEGRNPTTYSYDSANRSVTVTTAEGVAVTTTHNRFGQSVSIKDGLGHLTRYAYDLDGRLIGTYLTPAGTAAETKLEDRSYDHGGRLTLLTDAAGSLTRYSFDDANATLTRTVDAGSGGVAQTTEWQYDAKGQTVRETVAGTWVTSYTYDKSGRRVSRTVDPDGLKLKTEWVYDAEGREVKVTVKGLVAADDRVTTYAYDAAGRRVSETIDPAGLALTRRYGYDKAGQLVIAWDAQSRASRFAWDALGRQILTVNAAGEATETRYDATGHLTQSRRYAQALAGADTDTVWSEADIRAKLQPDAANDRIERQLWDKDGRLTHRIDALGGVTRFELDKNGQTVRQSRYATRVALTGTEEAIATAARAVAADPERDQVSRFEYDAQGRLAYSASVLRSAGVDTWAVTQNTYDAMGRLVKRTQYANTVNGTAALSTVAANATLDRTERWTRDGLGRELLMANALGGVTATTYDGAGHVASRTEIANSIGGATTLTAAKVDELRDPTVDRCSRYLWDNAGRNTRTIDALNGVTDYVYWASGEVQSETRYATALAAGALPDAKITANADDRTQRYTYDRAGRLATHTDASGMIEESTYFTTGEVKTFTQAKGQSEETRTDYGYDRAGRRTFITLAANGTADERATTTTTYDALGNAIETLGAVGNALLTSDGTWAQTERGRLGYPALVASLTDTQKTALRASYVTQFAYDQRGQLVCTTNAMGATTRTLYDALGNAVRIQDPLGNYGYFYYDTLGRVTSQVDAERYVTETTYDTAFGKEVKTLVRRYNQVAASVTLSDKTPPAVVASATMDVAQQTNVYDKLGRLLKSTSPAGSESTAWGVGTNRFDKKVTNALGGTSTYLTDRLGHVLTETIAIDKDSAGNLITVTNRYSYNALGDRIQMVEADGWVNDRNVSLARVTTFRYDKAGRVTHKIGMAYDAFDANGSSLGSVTPLELTCYDRLGRVTQTYSHAKLAANGSADISGAPCAVSYYDRAGRRVAQVEADGAYTVTAYTADGQVYKQTAYATRVSVPANATSQPTPPDEPAQPLERNRTVLTEYDAVGRVSQRRLANLYYCDLPDYGQDGALPLDLRTAPTPLADYLYDAAGRIISEADGRGNHNFTYYDKLGRKTLVIDREGYATAYDYTDVFDSATKETRYATRVPQYTPAVRDGGYWLRALDVSALQATDAPALRAWLGNTGLDGATAGTTMMRMLSSEAEGQTTTLSRSLGTQAAGQTVTVSVWMRADALTTSQLRLTCGNQTAEVLCNGSSDWQRITVSLTLAQAGEVRVALMVDADKALDVAAKVGQYANFDKLQSSHSAAGGGFIEEFGAQLSSEWTLTGANVAYVSEAAPFSPEARVTTYDFDRAGNVKKKTLQRVETRGVDADGLASAATAKVNLITDYTYNALGQIIKMVQHDSVVGGASYTSTTEYDLLGRERSRTDPGYVDYLGALVQPSVETRYDALGRVTARVQGLKNWTDGQSRVTKYEYEGDRLVQQIDAAQNVIKYVYDDRGRVSRRTQVGVLQADGSKEDYITAYHYDAAGRVIQQYDRSSGEVRRSAYNAFGEINLKGTGYVTPQANAPAPVAVDRSKTSVWQEFIVYNLMGKVERSNTEGGVVKVFLYDRNGNVAHQVRDTGFVAASGTSLRDMDVITAAGNKQLVHMLSLYDRRNQLIRSVEPRIETLVSDASLGQTIGTQWVKPYDPTGATRVDTQASGSAGAGAVYATPSNSGVGATLPTVVPFKMEPSAKGREYGFAASSPTALSAQSAELFPVDNWSAQTTTEQLNHISYFIPESWPKTGVYTLRDASGLVQTMRTTVDGARYFTIPYQQTSTIYWNATGGNIQIKVCTIEDWYEQRTEGQIPQDVGSNEVEGLPSQPRTFYDHYANSSSFTNNFVLTDSTVNDYRVWSCYACINPGTPQEKSIPVTMLNNWTPNDTGPRNFNKWLLDLDKSGLPAGTYDITIKSFDINKQLIGGTLLKAKIGGGAQFLGCDALKLADAAIERTATGQCNLSLLPSRVGTVGSGSLYFRQVGSTETSWSGPQAFSSFKLQMPVLNASTTYEYLLVMAGGSTLHGAWQTDASNTVSTTGLRGMPAGMLETMTSGPTADNLLSLDVGTYTSYFPSGSYQIALTVNGVAKTFNFSGSTFSFRASQFGVSPRDAFESKSCQYSYTLYALTGTDKSLIGECASGKFWLGTDPHSSTVVTSSGYSHPTATITTGNQSVVIKDGNGTELKRVPPGSTAMRRDVMVGSITQSTIDLTNYFVPNITKSFTLTYEDGIYGYDQKITIDGTGRVTLGECVSHSARPVVNINIPYATTQQMTVSYWQTSAVAACNGGGGYTWDVANLKPSTGSSTIYFSYEVKAPGSSLIVASGSGHFVIKASGEVSECYVGSAQRIPVVEFSNLDAAATKLTLKPTAGGADVVLLPVPGSSPPRFQYNALALRPAIGQPDAATRYSYTAVDASGKVVNEGTTTVTVQSNGWCWASTQVKAQPTLVPFTFGNPNAKWIKVTYKQLSGGDLKSGEDWVAVSSTTATGASFNWTVPDSTSSEKREFDLQVFAYETKEPSYKRACNVLGQPMGTHAMVTVGGTVANKVDVREEVTVFTKEAQTRHLQSYNAFGEIAEEYDDLTYERMRNMVAQFGGNDPGGTAYDTGNNYVNRPQVRTQFVYNNAGQLIKKTDPQTVITYESGYAVRARPTTTWGYDLLGRLTVQTDANGNQATQRYVGATEQAELKRDGAGGKERWAYDAYGDQRSYTNANLARTSYTYDKLGHMASATRESVTRMKADATWLAGVNYTDLYTTDVFGHRVVQLDAAGGVTRTDYDSLGRVRLVTSAALRKTTYTYDWKSDILGAGGAVYGGWQLTSVAPDGHGTVDRTDVFGRTTWHQDMGARQYTYSYNHAGWLVAQWSGVKGAAGQQHIAYTYYANGLVHEIIDIAQGTLSQFGYDNAGNRIKETYSAAFVAITDGQGQTRYTAQNIAQAATIDYDELGRMRRVLDEGRFDVSTEYDAVGNRRAVMATYFDPLTQGTWRQDINWYTYDGANRFLISMGSLNVRGSSASAASAITRGAAGVQLTYDLAGQRKSAVYTDSEGRQVSDSYTYTSDGYLTQSLITVAGQPVKTDRRLLDALGRSSSLLSYSGSTKTSTTDYGWDNDNRALWEKSTYSDTSLNTDIAYRYYSDAANSAYSATGAGELARKEIRYAKAGAVNTATTYSYQYWDSAKTSNIRVQSLDGGADLGWAQGVSQLTYDVNGYVKSDIDAKAAGGAITRTYRTNAQGLVTQRTESQGSATFAHYWYYAGGHRIGEVYTKPGDTSRVSYAESLALLEPGGKQQTQSFKDLKPVTSADFDQNYEPINRGYPGPVASSYVVRSGDTLKGIAQALWGDASMWWLLGEANNLDETSPLTAGQVLTVPNKVTNIHNNANTFRPYNPGEVIGHIDPTLPSPPPQPQADGGCGGIGLIIMVVVAVVVTIMTEGAAASAMAEMVGTGVSATGTAVAATAAESAMIEIGAAAMSAAAGSAASQLVGMAMGNVKSFSFKQVALSAVSAGVVIGGGSALQEMGWLQSAEQAAQAVGEGAGIASSIDWMAVGRGVVSAAAASAATQLVQGKWSWREIAASAVGGAAGSMAGQASSGLGRIASQSMAGMAGGLASEAVRRTDPGYQRGDLTNMFLSSVASAVANSAVEGFAGRASAPPTPTDEEKARIAALFEGSTGSTLTDDQMRALQSGFGPRTQSGTQDLVYKPLQGGAAFADSVIAAKGGNDVELSRLFDGESLARGVGIDLGRSGSGLYASIGGDDPYYVTSTFTDLGMVDNVHRMRFDITAHSYSPTLGDYLASNDYTRGNPLGLGETMWGLGQIAYAGAHNQGV